MQLTGHPVLCLLRSKRQSLQEPSQVVITRGCHHSTQEAEQEGRELKANQEEIQRVCQKTRRVKRVRRRKKKGEKQRKEEKRRERKREGNSISQWEGNDLQWLVGLW